MKGKGVRVRVEAGGEKLWEKAVREKALLMRCWSCGRKVWVDPEVHLELYKDRDAWEEFRGWLGRYMGCCQDPFYLIEASPYQMVHYVKLDPEGEVIG